MDQDYENKLDVAEDDNEFSAECHLQYPEHQELVCEFIDNFSKLVHELSRDNKDSFSYVMRFLNSVLKRVLENGVCDFSFRYVTEYSDLGMPGEDTKGLQELKPDECVQRLDSRNPLDLPPKSVFSLPGNAKHSTIVNEKYRITAMDITSTNCFWASLDEDKAFEPEVMEKAKVKLQKYFPPTEKSVQAVRPGKPAGQYRVLTSKQDAIIRNYFNSEENISKALRYVNDLVVRDADFMTLLKNRLHSVIEKNSSNFERLGEEINELTLPEQACVKIASIPFAATRMKLMIMKGNLDTYINSYKQGVEALKPLANELWSERFQKLLQLLLLICNSLNQGKHEPVYGFKLSFLNEVENTLSGADPNVTLMTYLADVTTNDIPELGNLWDDFPLMLAGKNTVDITNESYNKRLNEVIDDLKEFLVALADTLVLKVDVRDVMTCCEAVSKIASKSTDPFVKEAVSVSKLLCATIRTTNASYKEGFSAVEAACNYYLNMDNFKCMEMKELQQILKRFLGKLQMASRGAFLSSNGDPVQGQSTRPLRKRPGMGQPTGAAPFKRQMKRTKDEE